MTANAQDFIVVGKISSAYGIKGWVKVISFTDPEDNLLQYRPWYLKQAGQWKNVAISEGRNQQVIELGVVDSLMETGANDVLVVKGGSEGDKERLIPFVMHEFIKSVDLEKQTIHVDWDVDF